MSITLIRDLQVNKVYSWEKQNIAILDKNLVPIQNIQGIVNWIWGNEGLQYPPHVEELPAQFKKTAADATRFTIRFKKQTYTWIILHELAHSMTSDYENNSNWHGSLFMGVYIYLLAKYLNLNYETLKENARNFGLKVSDKTTAVFV